MKSNFKSLKTKTILIKNIIGLSFSQYPIMRARSLVRDEIFMHVLGADYGELRCIEGGNSIQYCIYKIHLFLILRSP